MLSNYHFVRKNTGDVIMDGLTMKGLMRRTSYSAVVLAGTYLLGTASLSAQAATSSNSVASGSVASGSVASGAVVSGLAAETTTGKRGERSVQVLAAAPSEYQTLYVNPEIGSDRAEGNETEPLQTVTRALEIAESNTVIVLAPGRYSRASGETFPLQLKSGVTIQGAPGTGKRSAIIEGGGAFESMARSQQNATILAADRAGIAQVVISNPDGYGVWVESANPTILETAFVGSQQTGLYVTNGSPRVQNNYFSGNGVAGLVVHGLSNASIMSNTFDNTGDAIHISDGATPEIVGNRITNNNASLVLIGGAAPRLSNNQVVGNRRNEVLQVASRVRESIARETARETVSREEAVRELALLATEPVIPQAAQPRAERTARAPVQPAPVQPAPIRSAPAQVPPIQSAPIRSAPRNVPIPADAIPGEMAGDLPILATSLPYIPPQTLAAAQPISRSIAAPAAQLGIDLAPATLEPSLRAEDTRRRSASAALPLEPLQLTNPPVEESDSVEIDLIEVVQAESGAEDFSFEDTSVADSSLADSSTDLGKADAIPAGAPGAALSALRAGVTVSSSRLLNGENPDSFRRDRSGRDRPENREDTNRRDVERAPSPPPISDDRLSVPSSRIPLGSGSSSAIFSPPTSGVGGPPAPPSRAQSLGLYYRVFVDAPDPFVQDDVRNVVPDAFRTRFEGRTVMQVGAFPTEAEAEDRQRILEDSGFNARIEYIR